MALKNKNIENRIGFGIGIYRTNFDTHKINLILGLEYNMTDLKVKDLMNGSHFSTQKNVTYVLHNLSIPIDARYNFGGKAKIFIQVGAYMDIPIYSKKEGYLLNYNPKLENNNENKKITQHNIFSGPDFGFAGSLGIRIPLEKHEITIKPAYKFGIRKWDYYFNNRYFRLSVGFRI